MDISTYFIILSQIIAIILDTALAEVCKQDGPCKCTTSKGTIDLSPITVAHKSLESKKGDDHRNLNAIYVYHLCYNTFSCGTEPGLTGVAVCQVDGTNYIPAGMQNTATISGDPDAHSLQIQYKGNLRTSTVKVVCDPKQYEPLFTTQGENPTYTYSFTLTSKFACLVAPATSSSGLSTGSVLVIIFFVLLVVYIVAGVLFLKFARGAQGSELVPNLGFWKVLPGLIRDGFLFVFRGCKTDATYSQI